MTADQLLQGNRGVGPAPALVKKYEHLQVADEQENVVRFSKTRSEWNLSLPAIHCTSCLILLESMNTWLEGVVDVRVQFSDKRANILFNEQELSLVHLAAWLDYVGYPPSAKNKTERSNKKLQTLGIAGFAMGNAMMSAFPEYFGLNEAGHSSLLTLFRYSTAFFATWSMLVAGRSYFTSSFASIRSASWSLDIPIALGMATLWLWSAWELVLGESGGYFDSLAGLVFFLLLGRWLQERTYAAFSFERTVKDFLPLSVFSTARQRWVRLEELKVGEEIALPQEAIVPLDVIAKEPCLVDYSFVTGESEPVAHQKGDWLHIGGKVVSAAVSAEVGRSAQTKSAEQLWNQKEETGWISSTLTARFTIGVLLTAIAGGLVWYSIDPSRAIEITCSVLIIACPCALSLAAPFAYGTALGRLGKQGLYLKNGRSIERLAEVKELAWDKTGTLTTKDMGESLSAMPIADQLFVSTMVNRSQHPVSRSLVALLPDPPEEPIKLSEWFEHLGKGLSAIDEEGNIWCVGSGSWLSEPPGPTYIKKNNRILAIFHAHSKYRKGLTGLFERLRKQGMNLLLISGDSPRILPKHWDRLFNAGQFYDRKPSEKAALLQGTSNVLFIGDGLNDVEALSQASVGLSVIDGDLGYFPKSDGVIEADQLPLLHTHITYAKKMVATVKWSYGLSLLYNAVGLTFALSGQLTPVVAAILMPLSSVTVVLFVVAAANLRAPKS